MTQPPRTVRLAAAAATALAVFARVAPVRAAAQVGTVFYIALENHNFTQPGTYTSLQPIAGNSAAPYINSLITPGNPNAAQSSYATNYTNSGQGVHPSEPNYIWAEGGTNFGNATDADPSAAAGNIYTAPHLASQMNAAGVAWKTYQEDVQLSTSSQKSASGTGGPTNPYYGTTQYNYAVKHNPTAFYSDTGAQNVAPLSQLSSDLSNNAVARYNWITPNQYNDMHSALSTDFAYNGTTYTHGTDQEAVAIGDHFLSVVVPQIMASDAYKNNGAIVIWNDETEGGDTTGFTNTEIVLSPLAKGNAYASSVALSHSSDIKTMEEVFQLGSYLNNPIPASALNASGTGYNTVAGSNDLSDLFVSGAIPTTVPEPTSLGLIVGGFGACCVGRRRRGGVRAR